jgi:hypothetical protein
MNHRWQHHVPALRQRAQRSGVTGAVLTPEKAPRLHDLTTPAAQPYPLSWHAFGGDSARHRPNTRRSLGVLTLDGVAIPMVSFSAGLTCSRQRETASLSGGKKSASQAQRVAISRPDKVQNLAACQPPYPICRRCAWRKNHSGHDLPHWEEGFKGSRWKLTRSPLFCPRSLAGGLRPSQRCIS